MTKTFSMTISLAVAVFAVAAATAPAQAANRLMSSTVDAFVFRCEKHDGIFQSNGTSIGCQTPSVAVLCDYFDERQAVCEWPGILNQIDVIRVIGTLPASYAARLSSEEGDAVGALDNVGGGFEGPNDISDVPDGGLGSGLNGPSDIADVPHDEPGVGFEGPHKVKRLELTTR
jgi:hypothetical protein